MRGQQSWQDCEPSHRATLRSRGTGHLVGCLTTPQAISWLVLTDNETTERKTFQHWATFTVCGILCYQHWGLLLSTSLFLSLKSLLAVLFSPSVTFSFCLSWRKRGLGISSVAELRFRMSSGMVEPLIYRKDKRLSPEERDTPRKYEIEINSSPGLSEMPSDSDTAQRLVYWRYHTGSTIPQVFKLYVQTSLGIITADIENPNFMKSLFKAIYLLLLLPSWTPERQILIWSRVKQIKWNILLKAAKIHRR